MVNTSNMTSMGLSLGSTYLFFYQDNGEKMILFSSEIIDTFNGYSTHWTYHTFSIHLSRGGNKITRKDPTV